MMINSKRHLILKSKLEKIIKENQKRNKNKNKKNKIAIFIGATTGVIVALEKKLTLFIFVSTQFLIHIAKLYGQIYE